MQIGWWYLAEQRPFCSTHSWENPAEFLHI